MSSAVPFRFLALALLWFVGSVHAFEYAGLDRTVDPASLRAMFPASRHEFWERGTGSVVVPEDEDGRFETMLKQGSGRYVVRLAPDDTRAEVTMVSLTLDTGKVVRLGLGFEREGQGIKPESIERRFPTCRTVLDALVARYGKPPGFSTRVEENLQHRLRTWHGADGSMRLDCGRFTSRRPIFAMDIEFEATDASPGRDVAPTGRAKPTRRKR
ncbi:MAG: hypothetical protein ABI794_03855 [Betaproteobacteria bacterium]